jgi:hypothetical protein
MIHRTAFLTSVSMAASAAVALACSGGNPVPQPQSSGTGNSTGGGAGGMGGMGGAQGGTTSTGGVMFGGGGAPFPSAGTTGAGGGCARSSFESSLLPTSILFVVDRSGSMNCLLTTSAADCEQTPPQTPQQGSRWTAITSALRASLIELSRVPDTSVGLSFFSNDDLCGVNSQPNVGVNLLTQPQLDALDASLSAVTPSGGTPIIGATVLAYQHLHEEAQAPGNRFVVLVTDGKDSCLGDGPVDYGVPFDPEQQLLGVEMPKAKSVNIRTFVIGAPGSEGARSLLSRIAWEGNTARSETCNHSVSAPNVGDCHFDMTTSADFAAEFADALNDITGRAALTCEYAMPTGDEVDPEKVNVSYFRGGTTEVELFRDDTKACDAGAQGWQYVGADTTRIILCGDICNEIRSGAEGRVDIVLGCETRFVPR